MRFTREHMSFGNILERPLREVWKETSQHFCVPGCTCYANKSNDAIAAKKPEFWPLNRETTQAVLKECPSYEKDKIPEFYRRMGMKVE